MRRAATAALLGIALLALTLSSASGTESVSADSTASQGIITIRNDAPPGAVRKAWTQERMAEAGVLSVSAEGARRIVATADAQQPAPAGSFVRRAITDTTQAPYKSMGYIFAHDPELGEDYRCSGTVVESEHRSLVVTAGHCLYGNGTFAEEIVFVPAAHRDQEPFGVWEYEAIQFGFGWALYGDKGHDAAGLLITPKEKTIGEVVGELPIAFNQPVDQTYQIYGYPVGANASLASAEKQLYVCDTRYAGSDDSYTPATPPRDGEEPVAPIGAGCDMRHGASGGAWLNEDGAVVSVLSYGDPDRPIVYGPYLGDILRALIDAAGKVLTHRTLLSLKLTGNLIASGDMTIDDGYLDCIGGTVHIQRKTSRWTTIKSVDVDLDGTYRVRLAPKAGSYRAFTPAAMAGAFDRCTAAASPTRIKR